MKAASSEQYMPIKVLNTFTKEWTILARVSKKADLKPTSKGGHILKTELIDKLGTQIEAVFFNDAATHFDKVI